MLSGIKNAVPKVSMRAINKTLTGVRTDAVKEISNIITPTKKIIRSTISLHKATPYKLSGSVVSFGRPLPLLHYLAKPTKKGVSVKIKRAGKRKLFKHAWIGSPSPGGKAHTRVLIRRVSPPHRTKASSKLPWKRMQKAGLIPKAARLPLDALAGPRVADIFSNDAVFDAVSKKAWPRLKKNFDHEIDYELSRHK